MNNFLDTLLTSLAENLGSAAAIFTFCLGINWLWPDLPPAVVSLIRALSGAITR